MPEFDVSRWIEKRYDVRITAETSDAALKIAENMRNEEWGEPEALGAITLASRNISPVSRPTSVSARYRIALDA